jgi:hypothetical protein
MDIEINPTLTWVGEVRPTKDPMGVLCTFSTIHFGLRAGALDLYNQQKMHGLNTWREIIYKFAPPVENDTVAYLNAMCEKTGVGPDDTIDLTDFDFLVKSTHAIIWEEQGCDPYTHGEVEAAISTFLPPTGASAK